MSAHDAVVIITLTNDIQREYRVSYIPNVETLSSFITIKKCFSSSKVFSKPSDAIKEAQQIIKTKQSRYGILRMNRYHYYEWDDIVEGAKREHQKISNRPRF